MCRRGKKVFKETGIEENTVIIFTSDNGGLSHKFGKHLNITDNSPLRAGKGSSYEGGTRVPLIIKWPELTPPQSICREPVSTIDFFPTILESCSDEIEIEPDVDGKNIVPLLQNPSQIFERNKLYWHYPHYHPGGMAPHSAIRSGDWKLIKFYEENNVELYNLKMDISEEHNKVKENSNIKNNLLESLNLWLERVNAQKPIPNPNYDTNS